MAKPAIPTQFQLALRSVQLTSFNGATRVEDQAADQRRLGAPPTHVW